MISALAHDKREAQKQWNRDPCGAATADSSAPGTLKFYRSIRRHRYSSYAPWLESVIRFGEWQGRDVLEIGVGVGSDHFRFAANGNRLTAVDLSREHLRMTAEHLGCEGLSTKGVLGDAESLPFPDASFDLVYSFGVLHHTPQTAQAVREIRRVLRPGGQVIAALYHRNSAFFWFTTVVTNGLVRRGLLLKGLRRLMSEIEHRDEPGSACPLVKVYSRRQLRRMFTAFRNVTLTSAHVEASHFAHIGGFFSGITRSRLESGLARFGWYLVVRGAK